LHQIKYICQSKSEHNSEIDFKMNQAAGVKVSRPPHSANNTILILHILAGHHEVAEGYEGSGNEQFEAGFAEQGREAESA